MRFYRCRQKSKWICTIFTQQWKILHNVIITPGNNARISVTRSRSSHITINSLTHLLSDAEAVWSSSRRNQPWFFSHPEQPYHTTSSEYLATVQTLTVCNKLFHYKLQHVSHVLTANFQDQCCDMYVVWNCVSAMNVTETHWIVHNDSSSIQFCHNWPTYGQPWGFIDAGRSQNEYTQYSHRNLTSHLSTKLCISGVRLQGFTNVLNKMSNVIKKTCEMNQNMVKFTSLNLKILLYFEDIK